MKRAALIFDWDLTLSPHYMQKPLFEEYKVEESSFWKQTKERYKFYSELCTSPVHEEHEYLNLILDYVRDGIFEGLTNEKLSDLGKNILLYPGVQELFETFAKRSGVNIFIVTSGIADMINHFPFLNRKGVFGAQFGPIIESRTIDRIISYVSAQDKVGIIDNIVRGGEGFDSYEDIIYVGDGLSDFPAFKRVKSQGGKVVLVHSPGGFPKYPPDEFDLVAEADYRPGSSLRTFLETQLDSILDD